MRVLLQALVALLAAGVLVADLAVLTDVVEREASAPAPAPSPSPSPTHPAAWDQRVLGLVEFVERTRGLKFAHPVEIAFLTAEEYGREITVTEAPLGEELEQLERFEGLWRAVGLIASGADLREEATELVEEGTLAVYDPVAKRILLKGTELTVGHRVTLVHELTHALQDQHFDLSRLDDFEDDGEIFAFESLVEGDAIRIENLYVGSLNEADFRAYTLENQGETAEVDLEGIPVGLIVLFGAPYALGEPFVEILAEASGAQAVDRAFREPPHTQEHILDPFAYLFREKVREVAATPADGDAEIFDEGTFGAVAWYVVLASRVGSRTALRAADGWGGDAYVAYESDGRACFRIRYEGDTPGDVDEMLAAIRAWVTRIPPGTATVERRRGGLLFRSCDPGDRAVEGDLGVEALLGPPATRGFISLDLLSEGTPQRLTRCASRLIVQRFTDAEIADPALFQRAGAQRRILQIGAECQ